MRAIRWMAAGMAMLATAGAPMAVAAQARGDDPAGQGALPPEQAPLIAPQPLRTAADAPVDPDRAALQPRGTAIGPLRLYPTLDLTSTYNDNVYATPVPTGDLIGRARAGAIVQGDFGVTTLVLDGSGERYRYVAKDSENRTDWKLGLTAQHAIAPGTIALVSAGRAQLHEDRGDPNAIVSALRPTRYAVTEAMAGLSRDGYALRYGVESTYRRYSYRNGIGRDGGVIDNGTRDRDSFDAAARLGYGFSPDYGVLARLSVDRQAYAANPAFGGIDRNSHGYRASIGVRAGTPGILSGELTVGRLHRAYADPRLADRSAWLLGAEVNWSPTRLTTLRGQIDRRLRETIAFNYGDYLDTRYSVTIGHDLFRTLRIDGQLRYATNQYRGSPLAGLGDREDRFVGGEVGAVYTLNRTLLLDLRYARDRRTSTVALPDTRFTRNMVSAKLGVRL